MDRNRQLIHIFHISREALKWIAVISMFCDHLAICLFHTALINHDVYILMRIAGRVSFPLFCFLLVQGFSSTRNSHRYLTRLFVFACISEIPFDLFFYHSVFSLKGQNVMFTLFVSLFVLVFISHQTEHLERMFALLILGSLVLVILRADYSYLGVLFTVILFLYQKDPKLQFMILCVLTGVQGGLNQWEILSLPLIFMTDKTVHHKQTTIIKKYFFYAFYPIHLLSLFFLEYFLLKR